MLAIVHTLTAVHLLLHVLSFAWLAWAFIPYLKGRS